MRFGPEVRKYSLGQESYMKYVAYGSYASVINSAQTGMLNYLIMATVWILSDPQTPVC